MPVQATKRRGGMLSTVGMRATHLALFVLLLVAKASDVRARSGSSYMFSHLTLPRNSPLHCVRSLNFGRWVQPAPTDRWVHGFVKPLSDWNIACMSSASDQVNVLART
eukprot:1024356-Pyramimonas_sp.AAC.2